MVEEPTVCRKYGGCVWDLVGRRPTFGLTISSSTVFVGPPDTWLVQTRIMRVGGVL